MLCYEELAAGTVAPRIMTKRRQEVLRGRCVKCLYLTPVGYQNCKSAAVVSFSFETTIHSIRPLSGSADLGPNDKDGGAKPPSVKASCLIISDWTIASNHALL